MAVTHYDLWLTAAQRVYQSVPYEVLADWLQQGRVLGRDKVRPAGRGDWQTVDEVGILAVYLPSEQPATLPEDRAEALEPLDLGIEIRRTKVAEDDDVDMIPLIDISLVLLIFFMMTSTVSVAGARVDLPETQFARLTSNREMLWVGIDIGKDGQPTYSFGEGERAAEPGDSELSLPQVLAKVRDRAKKRGNPPGTIVRVAAHRRLPYETVQSLTAELTKLRGEGVVEIKAEVSEKAR